jgi:hypothetical protein
LTTILLMVAPHQEQCAEYIGVKGVGKKSDLSHTGSLVTPEDSFPPTDPSLVHSQEYLKKF